MQGPWPNSDFGSQLWPPSSVISRCIRSSQPSSHPVPNTQRAARPEPHARSTDDIRLISALRVVGRHVASWSVRGVEDSALEDLPSFRALPSSF